MDEYIQDSRGISDFVSVASGLASLVGTGTQLYQKYGKSVNNHLGGANSSNYYQKNGYYPGMPYLQNNSNYPGTPYPQNNGHYAGVPYPQSNGNYPGMSYPQSNGNYPGMPYPQSNGNYPGMPYPQNNSSYEGVPYPQSNGNYPGMPYPQNNVSYSNKPSPYNSLGYPNGINPAFLTSSFDDSKTSTLENYLNQLGDYPDQRHSSNLNHQSLHPSYFYPQYGSNYPIPHQFGYFRFF